MKYNYNYKNSYILTIDPLDTSESFVLYIKQLFFQHDIILKFQKITIPFSFSHVT